MPKQKISEEERKRRSERMKAIHAAKRAKKEQEKADVPEEPAVPKPENIPEGPKEAPPAQAQVVPGVQLTNEQFEMLLQRFSGMANDKPSEKKIEGVGIIERFPIAAENYANPVENLYDLPRLSRFSMRVNYVIDWRVTVTRYETRQGQWYMEPRFELTLKRKQLDDEGNEIVKTDKNGRAYHPRIVLGRASFFVDPPADLIEAEQAGLQDAGLSDDELRERMMFWRYAMWIEERLIPKKPDMNTSAVREEVIGGVAYQIEEYSTPA